MASAGLRAEMPGRVALRLSPSRIYGTMSDSDPYATFGYVARRLNDYGLAYLHVIEPHIRGIVEQATQEGDVTSKDIRRIYRGTVIAAGGFTGTVRNRSLPQHADSTD